MHDIIQKKSKDKNVLCRGCITLQEIGVVWVGFEAGALDSTVHVIEADKMKKETKHTYPTYTANLCCLF